MRFLRYPGSKRKFINFIQKYFPDKQNFKGRYIEPFVGGGAVFLAYSPSNSIINDINTDLIDLYNGIRNSPTRVWKIFSTFPRGKKTYYKIRDSKYKNRGLSYRAARILYLNRTCFKGMWRHGLNGNFNVGYGGEERRWVINYNNLVELSKMFKNAEIINDDFAKILDEVKNGDFIFLDPPYKPGEKELKDAHYSYGKFTFEDQIRLSEKLKELSKKKKVKWLMTNSNHCDVKKLYNEFDILKLKYGTSQQIGVATNKSKEVIIKNF